MDDIRKINQAIDRFNKERDWDQFHTPENLAKSISIEANELLECFQWSADEYDINSVKEELADVFSYCFMMAMRLDMDVKDIVLEKLKKTSEKYPVEKARGVSTKYTEL